MKTGAPICEAMIMAAGLGTRMRPLTNDRPKPLVALAGRPMIDHVLTHLAQAGIRRAVVNVHYLPDMLTAHLGAQHLDVDIAISDESALLLETGGGLVKAAPLLGDAPFFCINSDNIWTDEGEAALTRMKAAWDDAQMDALLLLVPQDKAHNHAGKGDFFLSEAGRPARRGDEDSAPFIFTGIQIVSKRLLGNAPDGAFSTNILWDRAIAAGRLYALEHKGHWFDVGTPAAIAPTEDFLASVGA